MFSNTKKGNKMRTKVFNNVQNVVAIGSGQIEFKDNGQIIGATRVYKAEICENTLIILMYSNTYAQDDISSVQFGKSPYH